MIRTAMVLFLLLAAAVTVVALAGDHGEAHLIWQGWRLDMSAAAAVVVIGAGALATMLIWRLIVFILETPARAARRRAEQRRAEGLEALSRGFLAAAAGDGGEARRLALKSADLMDDAPGLVRLLAAQAADASGDRAASLAAFSAMLGFPEMRLAGRRGLMKLALDNGDREAALVHAGAAYKLERSARWAWRALFEAHLQAGDWSDALRLAQEAMERKIIPPLVADRAKAALLAALAGDQEQSGDLETAQDSALAAAKLRPDFAPGVASAARLMVASGKGGRAASLIEAAWKARPHPALWLAWRDLETHETPPARAERLRALAGCNPASRESQLLTAEAALTVGDGAAAKAALAPLDQTPITRRLAGLFARASMASGALDEGRAWMARGAAAPQEPDWSDLDPAGPAFAYRRADWARLVATYAETGDLIHPRLERGESTLSELPDLPGAFRAPPAYVSAAAADFAAPLPDDPGVYERAGDVAASRATAKPRRRLATTPRAAK